MSPMGAELFGICPFLYSSEAFICSRGLERADLLPHPAKNTPACPPIRTGNVLYGIPRALTSLHTQTY